MKELYQLLIAWYPNEMWDQKAAKYFQTLFRATTFPYRKEN